MALEEARLEGTPALSDTEPCHVLSALGLRLLAQDRAPYRRSLSTMNVFEPMGIFKEGCGIYQVIFHRHFSYSNNVAVRNTAYRARCP